MEQCSASIELKTVDFERRVIGAYVAIHHNIDRVNDIIDPSASVKAVKRLAAPSSVGVFIGHDSTRLPVGIPQLIQATPRGLYTETYILKGHEGDNLLAVAKDMQDHGMPLGASIGYKTVDSRHETAGRRRVRRIMDYDLKEFSYASPHTTANPEAVVTSVKVRRKKALSEGSDGAGGALVPADRKGTGMQYRVAQQGTKWAVLCDDDNDADSDDNRVIGTYASQEIANQVALALRKEAGSGGDDESDEGNEPDEKTVRRKGGRMQEAKALWSTAEQNKLPDSSFLYVEDGGTKDEDGKTVPRDKRHFPIKDADGKIDLPHLRNAIARIPQSNAPGLDGTKKSALQSRARALLQRETGNKEGAGKTIDPEDEEWKAGAPLAIRGLAYRLLDLSEKAADEVKALRLLGEETRDGYYLRPSVSAEYKQVLADAAKLGNWIEIVTRGDDGKARLALLRQQLALTEV